VVGHVGGFRVVGGGFAVVAWGWTAAGFDVATWYCGPMTADKFAVVARDCALMTDEGFAMVICGCMLAMADEFVVVVEGRGLTSAAKSTIGVWTCGFAIAKELWGCALATVVGFVDARLFVMSVSETDD
jgi:hypothetical protein